MPLQYIYWINWQKGFSKQLRACLWRGFSVFYFSFVFAQFTSLVVTVLTQGVDSGTTEMSNLIYNPVLFKILWLVLNYNPITRCSLYGTEFWFLLLQHFCADTEHDFLMSILLTVYTYTQLRHIIGLLTKKGSGWDTELSHPMLPLCSL